MSLFFRSWDVNIRSEDEMMQEMEAAAIDWDIEEGYEEKLKEENTLMAMEREEFSYPPSLLSSSRVYFPSQKGYIEIGRIPIDEGGSKFDFNFQAIIANQSDWLELNEEELINFFLFLRRSNISENHSISDSSFDPVLHESFYGKFTLNYVFNSDQFVGITYNNGEGDENDITHLLKDDVDFILKNESIFAVQMQRVRECVSELISKMESLKLEIVDSCLHGDHIDPMGLHEIIENDDDVFKLEMATNWWPFFAKQILDDKRNIL